MIQLELPLRANNSLPCSFDQIAYEEADRIFQLHPYAALQYISDQLGSSPADAPQLLYWIQVRRACKFIIAWHDYWFKGYHWRLPVFD